MPARRFSEELARVRTSPFVLPGLLVAALAVAVPAVDAGGAPALRVVAATGVAAAAPTADGGVPAPATRAAAGTATAAPASRATGSTTSRIVLRQEGTPDGAVDRPYLLSVPNGLTGPAPLVLALHGRAQTVDSLRSASGLEALGEREGFVTAFPSGYGAVWNAGTCCAATRVPAMPDVAFLDQVVADVAQRVPVDLTRLHLVGYSNGGMMAYRYACQRSARVAGVGVVSGSMAASPDYADQGAQRCRPDSPVSVVAVHGAQDTTVPYQGGEVLGSRGSRVAPARAGVDQAAVAAGCTTASTSRVGATSRLDYGSCQGGAAVRLVKVAGHGHGWTRDSRRYGYDTTVGIWSFLEPRRAASAG